MQSSIQVVCETPCGRSVKIRKHCQIHSPENAWRAFLWHWRHEGKRKQSWRWKEGPPWCHPELIKYTHCFTQSIKQSAHWLKRKYCRHYWKIFKVIAPTNEQMSHYHQEVFEDPEDISVQSDAYCGAENLVKRAGVEIDMQRVYDDPYFVDGTVLGKKPC